MGPGQDHRRRSRAAARPRVQRLTTPDAPRTRRIEVEPERVDGWVRRFRDRHGDLVQEPGDGALVLRAPDGAEATLTPTWSPTPEWPRSSGAGGDADPALAVLLDDVRRPRKVGVLLVRRGGYAAAVAEGTTVVASKVGRRHVQGKTKAGGWSQQRYARRRGAQAQQAFAAAADTAARVLLPYREDLEGLVVGGDRPAVREVLADRRLLPLADLPQSRFLAVPDPRRTVVDDALRRSRAVVVDVFDPDRD